MHCPLTLRLRLKWNRIETESGFWIFALFINHEMGSIHNAFVSMTFSLWFWSSDILALSDCITSHHITSTLFMLHSIFNVFFSLFLFQGIRLRVVCRWNSICRRLACSQSTVHRVLFWFILLSSTLKIRCILCQTLFGSTLNWLFWPRPWCSA